MSIKYNVIEIFTSEEARHKNVPLYKAIVQKVHSFKIAARCIVSKGVAGCYENGEISTQGIEILSFNMPLKIEIIFPSNELDIVLPAIEDMMTDGIVALKDLEIRKHITKARLIPSHLKVRDVMINNPKRINLNDSAADVIRMLLNSKYHAVPVVDKKNHPQGIITQDDLIHRAGMPVRLDLISIFEQKNVEGFLESISHKTAEEIMTKPIITVTEEKYLTEVVELMLKNILKRFPVVDVNGVLTGMIARFDIFRVITKESPDWKTLEVKKVIVDNIRFVRDIMQREVHTVTPETPLHKIIEIIDSNDIQRVAVVNEKGQFQGMIFDRDLLDFFSGHHANLWDHLIAKLPFKEIAKKHKELILRFNSKTAADIMKVNLFNIKEEASINEAVKLMSEKFIKRLPVIDDSGIFKGMVSRDSILRAEIIKP